MKTRSYVPEKSFLSSTRKIFDSLQSLPGLGIKRGSLAPPVVVPRPWLV